MSGGFAAQCPAVGMQTLEHIAVAHLGSLEWDMDTAERMLGTQIGHQRAHHATLHVASLDAMTRDDVDQLVAVVYPSLGIRHHQTVAVAIERDADVRMMHAYR